jgi:hypothetical protein
MIMLDGALMGELKTGTFLYVDRPIGKHQFSVEVSGFPGVTQHEFSIASGKTYFFLVRRSERSKALAGGQMAAGLVGYLAVAAATSKSDNLGPVDFISLDEAAARQAIADLRLIK